MRTDGADTALLALQAAWYSYDNQHPRAMTVVSPGHPKPPSCGNSVPPRYSRASYTILA